MLIGIPREPNPEQTLVAGTPDSVKKLIKLGYDVAVESGAGEKASYFDDAYEQAGAKIVSREEAWGADIVVCLDTPPDAELALIKRGATLIARHEPRCEQGHHRQVRGNGHHGARHGHGAAPVALAIP